MSGSVFVQDTHGTPLMPMAAAHARKLLQRARARRLPHHAFTIVQLAQAAVTPVLRPVLLGVQVRAHTAVLALVAEGARSVLPLLRVVVDLSYSPRSHMWSQSARRRQLCPRSRKCRVHYTPSTQADCTPHSTSLSVRRRAQIIVRVVGALRALAPISHLVVLTSPSLPPGFAGDLLQRLHIHPACAGLIVVDGIVVEQIASAQAAVLLQILEASGDSVVSLPVAVAACSDDRVGRRPSSLAQSESRLLGRLAQAPHDEREVMGIVAAVRSEGRVMLHVPRLVGENDVMWQPIHVQRRHLRVLSADPVIFLLVSPKTRT